MAIATCPTCRNTGYLGDRFCSCPFAATLRDRIEVAPEFAEFRRKRAEVDHMLARIEERPLNAAMAHRSSSRQSATLHASVGGTASITKLDDGN